MQKFTTKEAFAFYNKAKMATNKVTCEIKTATKPLVDSLIDMNTKNRPVKPSLVEKYVSEILRGQWLVTNQGIGVTEEGVLADGQHRLLAIQKCEYPPVQLLLVCGLSDEVRMVIDQQSKRSMRDVLYFAFDARIQRQSPAIANVILRCAEKTNAPDISPSTILDCIERYLDEIRVVVSAPKSKNFFAAPFLAGFVFGMHLGASKEQAERFIAQVETGEMLTRMDPAFHLRNYLMSTKKNSGGNAIQIERFSKTIKAFTAFLEGKEMGVLRV